MSVYSPFIPTFADMCFADAVGKNHKICWLLKNHKSDLLEYFKNVTSIANTKENGEQRPYTCKHNESKFSSAYCRNIASTKSARGNSDEWRKLKKWNICECILAKTFDEYWYGIRHVVVTAMRGLVEQSTTEQFATTHCYAVTSGDQWNNFITSIVKYKVNKRGPSNNQNAHTNNVDVPSTTEQSTYPFLYFSASLSLRQFSKKNLDRYHLH